ncbi:SDR family NAD(P)-dependent oxidoreductase [uncultured Sphingomonas sp.]|uniref:SDR family NAD(P)-dependent oxidoreductase n=1 Tax=uncultured Sphingomonas sp. TaxID=158754 RepID=UPI0035CC213D
MIEGLLFPRVRAKRDRLARAVAGKTIVVTGASHGIGEQVARQLGMAGAHVVLVARSIEQLAAVAAAIVADGGRVTVMPCDLTDQAQLDALIAGLLVLPGGVDVLVSNAGKSICRPLLASLDRPQDVARTMALNFTAPVRLVLALTPMLRARGGQVASVSAANVLLAPAPYWGAYQASKAAFDQWLRAAAPELRAVGIAVGTLYLPLVRTRMIAPTAAYDRMPAMTAEQAALRVCRMIATRRPRWTPWWLGAGELASLLLRRPWEAAMVRWARRRS